MSTADMLIDLGFAVTKAGSAEDALRLMAVGESWLARSGQSAPICGC